jgi:phosphodiesterase/alkaline phosphatase D-like protein
VNRVRAKLLIMVAAGSLIFSNSIVAQVSPYAPKPIAPPAPRAAHVGISQGPELEITRGSLAIIRWTTNNPGGTDVHFGIVHYGTNPNDLNQMAKNPIHINHSHPDTTFRVRIDGLSPQTTYYYTVAAEEATGTNDGVKSSVKKFSTQ